jgi:hypothetical protein
MDTVTVSLSLRASLLTSVGFGQTSRVQIPSRLGGLCPAASSLSCGHAAAIAGGAPSQAGSPKGADMSVQSVLLPVFVLIGLAFVLLIAMAGARRNALVSKETRIKDIALGQSNWPVRATQIGNCFKNQFELPVLFYVLIALALPLRHADLVIVVLSWVFVVTRLVHAGIFVTSNDLNHRSLAWFAGVLVLLAMWVYFALRILLLI